MDVAISHLAELVRLSLSEEEKKRFETDLTGILAYVDQLKEVETEGVAEIMPAAPEINQLREDNLPRVANEEEVAALRKAFPAREKEYARVPLIINKK